MAFVPKQNALDTLSKREAKAKETSKITDQKLTEQKKKAAAAKDSKTVHASDLTDRQLRHGLNLLLIGDSIAVDVADYYYKEFPNSISDTKIGRLVSVGENVYFDADDTHLLPTGAKAYAKLIRKTVLKAYREENIEIPKSRLDDTKENESTDDNTGVSEETNE